MKHLQLFEKFNNRKSDEEIFNYSSVINDEWRKIIKKAQDFQHISFDLENNDPIKNEKKTFTVTKNLRKDQPVKYVINAQLCRAGGDWQYPAMYFKIELNTQYGIISNKYEASPEYVWDVKQKYDDKGYSKLTHCHVLIPPIEAGNPLIKTEKGYSAYDEGYVRNNNLKKEVKIDDDKIKKVWKWLEELLNKVIDERHEMLDEPQGSKTISDVNEASFGINNSYDKLIKLLDKPNVKAHNLPGIIRTKKNVLVISQNDPDIFRKLAAKFNYFFIDYDNLNVYEMEHLKENLKKREEYRLIFTKNPNIAIGVKANCEVFKIELPIESIDLLDLNQKTGIFE